MTTARVEVWRGETLESVHRVHVAVVDAADRLRARAGDPDLITVARSAIKPLQALPLVRDGVVSRFELTAAELALCCASHSGEVAHVAAARSILEKVGCEESALACGPQAPFHEPTAAEIRAKGGDFRRVHNNCSGKHAGMLGLARVHDWPATGYEAPDHPVQRRMLAEVATWTGASEQDIGIAVDGCGVPTFALPLRRWAMAFARLAAAARRGEDGPSLVVRAMTRHPWHVGGTDRLCTELMRVAEGRLVAKFGVEGVYCASSPGAELGIALKVEDGAARAAEPALVATLQALGLLSDRELDALDRWLRPAILNTRGERVGRIRAEVHLDACAGDE